MDLSSNSYWLVQQPTPYFSCFKWQHLIIQYMDQWWLARQVMLVHTLRTPVQLSQRNVVDHVHVRRES
jgi:hypothetical protein